MIPPRDFQIQPNPADPSRPLMLLNERGEIVEVHRSAAVLRERARAYGAASVDGEPLEEPTHG